jgi:hypothetical protein
VLVDRLEAGQLARDPALHVVDGGVHHDLDLVGPALGEVLLDRGHGVEVGRCLERLGELLDGGHPVHPQDPASTGGVRPAEQVPLAEPHHDRPRVDVHLADLLGAEPVREPQSVPRRTSGHQRGRDPEVGRRGVAVRRPLAHPDDGLDGLRHRLRQHPDDLADRLTHRVGGVVRPALQHGHHQPERLRGGEHQWRQPDPAADPVPAVLPPRRLHRDAGVAQVPDVPADGPVGHPQPVRELLAADAGRVLHHLQHQQRPGRRRGLVHEDMLRHVPEGYRPEGRSGAPSRLGLRKRGSPAAHRARTVNLRPSERGKGGTP